jgi:hypothetical protein
MPEIARSDGCAEIETSRRLMSAFADISESIRERSRIAAGTSFLFCGRKPMPAGAAAGCKRFSWTPSVALTERLRHRRHGLRKHRKGRPAVEACSPQLTAMPRQPERPAKRETSLYVPVKRFLETLGFDVKGEICGCDLVAVRGEEPPLVVIGELKLGFNLELVLQGINRSAACDQVWLAVRVSGRRGRARDPRVRKLCRLLGFGLLGVSAAGRVEVLVEPGPWRPRRDAGRRSRLLDEHRRRLGDPAPGGTCRLPIMTAYRQQALACAASLSRGPRRTSEIKSAIPDAPKILLRNVYGWFFRVERGTYALTPAGTAALARWPQADAYLLER